MNDFRVYIRHAHPMMQLFLLIAVTLFAAGIMGAVGLLACETFFGANLKTIQEYINNPETKGAAGVLKVIQIFNSLGVFLLPAMIFSQILSPNPQKYLRLNRTFSWPALAAILLLFIAITPLTDVFSWLNNSVELPNFLHRYELEMRQKSRDMEQLMGTFLGMETFGQFLFNVFLMAVLPALGEEFFFRGIFQRLLLTSTRNVHVAVWITAIAFGLMHQQFFAILPLTLLGALLGYLKEWTGNLWASIFAHFVNNASIIVVMYFANYNLSDVENLSTPQFIYVIPALLICGGLIFNLYKNRVAAPQDDDDLGEELKVEG